jgi:hypothetical protein
MWGCEVIPSFDVFEARNPRLAPRLNLETGRPVRRVIGRSVLDDSGLRRSAPNKASPCSFSVNHWPSGQYRGPYYVTI